MIPAPLEYVRPDSLADALEALGGDESVALAGGHSLVPMLKLRLARPSLLVDVRGVLPNGVSREGSEVVIGAVTTWRELLAAGLSAGALEAASECAASIGDLQVRNHGTIGGSLAHADPASDFAAAALATDARLRLVSAGGERVVAADEFFAGPFTTILEQGELIAEIVLACEPGRWGSAYAAVEDPASGYPLAGAAVCVERNGSGLSRCRIGLTGVAAAPLRLRTVEARVVEAGAGSARAATSDALEEADVLGDVRADPAYRRRLAAVVVERALERAVERSGAAA